MYILISKRENKVELQKMLQSQHFNSILSYTENILSKENVVQKIHFLIQKHS